MPTYCQNPLCEHESLREVRVSVNTPSDETRSEVRVSVNTPSDETRSLCTTNLKHR